MGDQVVEEGRRWRELWIHYQAEELRVHHRARVPPQQPPLLGIQLPGARPLLERFWGTVRQHEARVYLILFINDRCLVLALSG